MQPGVEHSGHRPALGHVVELAHGAQVAQEAQRLLAVVEAQNDVQQGVKFGGTPFACHGCDPPDEPSTRRVLANQIAW